MGMIFQDWPEQLEVCQLRIAELEEKIASQRIEIQGLWDREMDATCALRILAINEQSLERAQAHKHQIEIRLATRRPQPAPARGRSSINPLRSDLMRPLQAA
jgi:hypothetical protein